MTLGNMRQSLERYQMTISAVSHYRGGTIEEVIPLPKALKVAHLKHGIGYRLGRFQSGPNVGDWFVIVQYDDQERAHAAITQDPEIQRIFAEIAKIARRISRETVVDLDL